MVDYGVDGENMIKAATPNRHSLAMAVERALELSPEEVAAIGRRAAATVATKFSCSAVLADWRHALQVLGASAAERRQAMLKRAGPLLSAVAP